MWDCVISTVVILRYVGYQMVGWLKNQLESLGFTHAVILYGSCMVVVVVGVKTCSNVKELSEDSIEVIFNQKRQTYWLLNQQLLVLSGALFVFVWPVLTTGINWELGVSWFKNNNNKNRTLMECWECWMRVTINLCSILLITLQKVFPPGYLTQWCFCFPCIVCLE